jgi:hypothetical protein
MINIMQHKIYQRFLLVNLLELRVIPTNQVPFIGDYVRIVCAISNRYFPALGRTVTVDDDMQLAREMQQKSTAVLYLCLFF